MQSRPPHAARGPGGDLTTAGPAQGGSRSASATYSEEGETGSVLDSEVDPSSKKTVSTIFPDDSVSQRGLHPRVQPAKWKPSQNMQSVSEGGDEPVYSFHPSGE